MTGGTRRPGINISPMDERTLHDGAVDEATAGLRANGGGGIEDRIPTPILPGAGLRGPVPWMVAVMTTLAMLGMAAALMLSPAAGALSGQIAGRATIQIAIGDAQQRQGLVRAVQRKLDGADYIRAVQVVPEAELQAMATQWLGETSAEDDLPLPALIDVDLTNRRGDHDAAAFQRLQTDVRSVAPDARVIAQADWLGPVAGLMLSVSWIAALAALLLALVAAAIAVVSARAALASQRSTIDILHLVGATDVQITRLFQKQVARDTALGALVGGALGVVLVWFIGWQLTGVTAELSNAMGWVALIPVVIVPLGIVIIAMVAARFAVLRALRDLP